MARPRIESSANLSLVGEAIARIRQERGLSRREVSNRTFGRVSESALAKYETGTEPTLPKYLWVCVALDVSPMELLPDPLRALLSARRYACPEKLIHAFEENHDAD